MIPNMQEVLRILGLLCLCVNIALASCPDYDSREGSCLHDSDCMSSNQCIGSKCCPRKYYMGVSGCKNGGDPEIKDKNPKACNSSHQCSSGFGCHDNICCPQSYNQFTGPCKNGGMAEMMKGSPRNCTVDKKCSYGGYNCSNGFCCPTKFNSDICPKRGIPAVSESGHPRSCDQENPCNMSTYSCFNNTCCPTAVFSDMCPRRGIPMFDEEGSAIRCNKTKRCPGTTFTCVPSGYCCPTTVFKDFCPNKGIPDIDEDGEAQMCNASHTCNNITHTCQAGYCCPIRIFSGDCSNGGDPEMTDNKTRKCTEGKKGCGDGFSCREGTCCPAKVFTGFCPKGGNVKTEEDMSAYKCKPGDTCGSGAFSCQGGYCCPQKVAFKGPCPNGGIAEMDKANKARTCDNETRCGGGYSCQNKHCCPSRVNDKICPIGGIAEKLDGGPRRCGEHNPCGSGYTCIEKYCCPMKFTVQDICLGNGMPLIEDDVLKSCKLDNDCKNPAFQCVNNHCCPRKFQAMGSCKNGGDPMIQNNGRIRICGIGGKQCGATYNCEPSVDGEEIMQCCPVTVDQNMNLTDVCGKNIGPLMTRNSSIALLCKDDSRCPDKFYCKMSNKMDEQVCCPQAVRTKPGQCPAVKWDNMTTCMSDCKTDADCPLYKICCANTCGLQCTFPVTQAKDGFCPSVPSNNSMPNKCLDQCSNDAHCEGNKKCCNNGCGNFCVDKMKVLYMDSICDKKLRVGNDEVILVANSSRLDSPPRHCKFTLISANSESHHRLEVKVNSAQVSSCDTSLTIYNGQTADDSPVERISCTTKTPKVLYSSRTSAMLHLQMMDNATSYSFVLRVKSVVDEKPGKCPAVDKGKSGICVQLCSADKDCKDDQKCCSNGCGKVCTKIKRECEEDFEAIKTKLQTQRGKCTEVFIPRCDKYGQYSKIQCKDNTGECWCENGRHKINNTRIRGNPDCTRATKPGLCPHLPAALKGKLECVEKCVTDDNCNTSRSKCCYHGCGTMCMAPKFEPDEDKNVCPDGKPEKCCDFHLCAHAACPAFPDATCRVNPCGSCSVQFFDDFDDEVNCTEGLSMCQIQAMKANQKKEDMTYSDSVKHFLDMVEREGTRERKGIESKNMTKTGPDDDDMSKEKTCTLPAMTGPCKAAKLRYYYDTKSKKCETFTYGGCDGNKNNFQSIKQCQKMCIEGQTRCAKPAFVGKCRAAIPRWFYNVTAGKCETFYYGGCDADEDDNIFVTEQACRHTCGHQDACEKKKCPEGTKCISIDTDKADCVSTKKMPTLGHYIPKCLSNGSFAPIQCYQKSHVCWCVDDDGRPLSGSISVGSKPDCSGKMKNESTSPACENKAKPMVCSDSCHRATCGRRTDVICRADPCDNCKVHFIDKKGKQVKCDMDMCKVTPPVVKKKPKFGCVNAKEMWYHDSKAKMCKSFSYSKICHGENMYFMSQEECQDECLASACQGRKMNKSCDDTCAGKVCPNLAKTAHCVVDKCSCAANFRDRFTNSIVNCQKLPTTCERFRAEEMEKNNKMKASPSSKAEEKPVPQCRDTGLFSPTQCDEQNCWCVGPTGNRKSGGQKKISEREDMVCPDDRVSEVIVRLRSTGDYDAIIKGRETNFKKVCREKIKELNKEVEIALKDCRVERGSIIIILVFEPNDEVPDPLSAAVAINDTVNAGKFSIEFDGKKLVVDGNDVSMEVMTQTGNNVPVVRRDDDHDNNTVVIVVVVIVSLAAIAMIIAAILLIKKKKQKDSVQFSSLEEYKDGISNTMYFSNSACE